MGESLPTDKYEIYVKRSDPTQLVSPYSCMRKTSHLCVLWHPENHLQCIKCMCKVFACICILNILEQTILNFSTECNFILYHTMRPIFIVFLEFQQQTHALRNGKMAYLVDFFLDYQQIYVFALYRCVCLCRYISMRSFHSFVLKEDRTGIFVSCR